MESEIFVNRPPEHFETAMSELPTWHSLTNSTPIELNCSRSTNWEKSTDDQGLNFDSALTSMVSSPTTPNSNTINLSTNCRMIEEVIGKLGNIENKCTTNTSCYNTPLNSPSKFKTLPVTTEYCIDPGFAGRAAKFSYFGSRSFNDRTTQFGLNNINGAESADQQRPKLSRVSSFPSRKVIESQNGNKNCPLQDQPNVSQDESSVEDVNANIKNPSAQLLNSKKRKAISKAKVKEMPKENSETNEPNTKKMKTDEEKGLKSPEPPKDYIHVRARRGQATDSHSLAERARREKISQRMKLLQDLVPGCSKVTGKALMLDEIINYVKLLQRQVEFLSMKLASVETNISFHNAKDIFQSCNNKMSQPMLPLDSCASINNIVNETTIQFHVDPLDVADVLYQNLSVQLPSFDEFNQTFLQSPLLCESDLQTMVEMGFEQNLTLTREMMLESQHYQGLNHVASRMKKEF